MSCKGQHPVARTAASDLAFTRYWRYQTAGAGARARDITRVDATGTTGAQEGEGPTRDRTAGDRPAQGGAPHTRDQSSDPLI